MDPLPAPPPSEEGVPPEPRLTWPGRNPYGFDPARPAIEPIALEICDPRGELEGQASGLPDDRLMIGDNLDAAATLIHRGYSGRFQLVYIDPPFASDVEYGHEVQVEERPESWQRSSYSDAWPGGLGSYLEMLGPRLEAIHRLLHDEGSLYVHLDHHSVHYVKVLLDEIFGRENFQREIIWRIGWISGFKSAARNWIRNHDTVLFYVKDRARFFFDKAYLPYPPGYRRRDGQLPKGKGIPLEDVWNGSAADPLDSIQIKSFSGEKTGFNTQKNLALLQRIIQASSRPGDLVGDLFAGSGTTAVAAATMSNAGGEPAARRWIGVERGPLGAALARTRLLDAGAPPFAIEGHARGQVLEEASPYRLIVEPTTSDSLEVVLEDREDDAPPVEAWSLDPSFDGLPFRGRLHRWRSLGRKRRAPERRIVFDRVIGGGTIAARVIDIFGQTTHVVAD